MIKSSCGSLDTHPIVGQEALASSKGKFINKDAMIGMPIPGGWWLTHMMYM